MIGIYDKKGRGDESLGQVMVSLFHHTQVSSPT